MNQHCINFLVRGKQRGVLFIYKGQVLHYTLSSTLEIVTKEFNTEGLE